MMDQTAVLPCRTLMMSGLNLALDQAQKENSRFMLVLCSLHSFQDLCEAKGHCFGDEVFRAIAQKSNAFLEDGTTLFRTAEDKFIVIVKDLPSDAARQAAIDSIRNLFTQTLLVGTSSVQLNASFGVVRYPQDGNTAEQLFRHAQIAARAAKDGGQNPFAYYSSSLGKEAVMRYRLASDLPFALEQQQLSIHYQPQFDTSSGKIRGFEALLRWQHPQLGPISPAEFIPIAEETGLIHSIGEWVMRTACQKNKQIQEKYFADSIMSVNLSGLQLQDPFFFERVTTILQQTGLSPHSLELELTERSKISLGDNKIETLRQFADYGIHIVMDDFGTEYASLEYITALPLSAIKVDRSFVNNIARHQNGTIVAEWIISLAHQLGLIVIAEGIETDEQLECLRKWKCDCVQGYLFSKPLHEHELSLFCRKFQWKKELTFHA